MIAQALLTTISAYSEGRRNVPSVAELIRVERDTPEPEVLAAVLLEFNDRLLERFILGGRLTRNQLLDGAAAVWLSTIYEERS